MPHTPVTINGSVVCNPLLRECVHVALRLAQIPKGSDKAQVLEGICKRCSEQLTYEETVFLFMLWEELRHLYHPSTVEEWI